MSEEEFWNCTIRKLVALLNVHKQLNGINSNTNGKNKTKAETITLKCVD